MADFTFKQFQIKQQNCAMKVGTDGVLLGAWAPLDNVQHILDMGTGTGLLALMAAQRAPQATISAVELDAAACHQAGQNVAASPWSERIALYHADVGAFCRQTTQTFDCCQSALFSSRSGLCIAIPRAGSLSARIPLDLVELGWMLFS